MTVPPIPPPIVDPNAPAAWPDIQVQPDVTGKLRDIAGDRKSSRAVMTSVLFHAAIIGLLVIIAAPRRIGRHLHGLVLRMDNAQANDLVAFTQLAPSPDDLADDALELDTETVDAVSESVEQLISKTHASNLQTANDAIQDGAKRGRDDEAASGAPGSFFGLESVGQRIVYVVDRSTSMRGERFELAKRELLRSIAGLESDQEFAVVFFAKSDLPIAAPDGTWDWITNAGDTRRWLDPAIRDVPLDDYTDPRDAIQTALRMNPDSLFVLSDGEFNGVRASDAYGGRTVFDLLDQATTIPRVQAIALHNEESLPNMKQLAEQTGGAYRFVPDPKSVDVRAGVNAALDAAKVGGVRPEPILAAKYHSANSHVARNAFATEMRRQFRAQRQRLEQSGSVSAIAGEIKQLDAWELPRDVRSEHLQILMRMQWSRLLAAGDDAATFRYCRELLLEPSQDLPQRDLAPLQYTALRWLDTQSRIKDKTTSGLLPADCRELIQHVSATEARLRIVLRGISRDQEAAAKMLESSRMLAQRGRPARAKVMLERLLDKYPLSSSSKTAKQWLATKF
ncbi:MAG: hypothetical protein AAF958_11385 [Planctomycetota bacterium]